MKSNKSYQKRVRVTKKGKLVTRVPGHNHFNAKRSGGERRRRGRASALAMTSQDRSRYMN